MIQKIYSIARKKTLLKRAKYYIPILKWLPEYSFSNNLIADLAAGLTVGSIIVPQSIAYAVGLAEVNPIYGLYSACVPLFIYALLGTSRYKYLKLEFK